MAEPVDPSKKHFYISLVKSAVRIVAGIMLVMGNVVLARRILNCRRSFRYSPGGTIMPLVPIVIEKESKGERSIRYCIVVYLKTVS